ncbi:MAG: CDP-alcohol phosphatidyltransferase family protein [Myxococcota bacterium]|nr:CDP-alcohol phosphatidyltransferase family protein [Myxococcota bacterium]
MSLIRVLCAPLLAFVWLGLGWYVAGLAIGTIIGLTDLLDGVVARKLNQITDLGALLDQLGDLVFESTCLIIAAEIGELWIGLLIVYLFREFTVMVIRAYVLGHGGDLPSSVLGKAKSSFLQWAFFLLFFGKILLEPGVVPADWTLVGIAPGRYVIIVAHTAILTGLVLGFLSGWRYLGHFSKFYTERTKG